MSEFLGGDEFRPKRVPDKQDYHMANAFDLAGSYLFTLSPATLGKRG